MRTGWQPVFRDVGGERLEAGKSRNNDGELKASLAFFVHVYGHGCVHAKHGD
jgi:hypothetical protein